MIRKKSFARRVLTLMVFKERHIVVNRFFSCLTKGDLEAQQSQKFIALIENIVSVLSPRGTNLTLKRVGGEGDGSYVLPEEFCSPKYYLISGGIDNNNSFEFELADSGVKGIQVDNSINIPPKNHPNLEFVRKTIGDVQKHDWVALSELINQTPQGKNLLLKLDIEGAEIAALNQLDQSELDKFDCLLFELHNLSNIDDKVFAEKLMNFLHKIQIDFASVFVQANNACLAYNLAGMLIPDNIEVTFIRKKETRSLESKDVKRIKSLTSKNNQMFAQINIDHILCRGLVQQ